MRELAERTIDEHGIVREPKAARRRSLTVNLAESPLAWLASRGLVDARQCEAGERLHVDYERAALGARVTMRWDGAPRAARSFGVEPGVAQLAAKRRFDMAIAAVGPGLRDILWRVVCAGEAMGVAEKGLGWPARSGRLVLGFALTALADHYRLP